MLYNIYGILILYITYSLEDNITKWTTHLFVISKPWIHSQRIKSNLEVQ